MTVSMTAYVWDKHLKPSRKLVLLYISNCTHTFDEPVPYYLERIAAFAGVTVPKARQILKELADQGEIAVTNTSIALRNIYG